jgi:hypothetical protein
MLLVNDEAVSVKPSTTGSYSGFYYVLPIITIIIVSITN